MKKKVLFVASLFLATATFAQDGLTSKKGEAYLPEAGDWAIGFDAMPFLDYASNGNLPTANWVANNQPMTLVGKMFKDETTAYRMKLRIGFGGETQEGVFDTSTTTLTGELTDEMKTSGMMITLGGGIEKRKGNTRLQGFYGAEALVSFGGYATEYTYADQSSGTAAAGNVHIASQFDFGTGNTNYQGTGERVLKNTAGGTFALQLRGFIGVEYFFAPKISVAAEYGWGLMMSSTGAGEVDTEKYEVATGASDVSNVARKHTTGGSSAFGIDTDNNGGQITLMFHF